MTVSALAPDRPPPGPRARAGVLVRAALAAAAALPLALGHHVGGRCKVPGHRGALRLFHRVALRLFGVSVEVVGRPLDGPVLLAGNHVSPLDVPIVSSVVPACFVAKREIASWPVIGAAARLQDTVFVEARSESVRRSLDEIEARLRAGRTVAIFPEGKVCDGVVVRAFRSGGIGAAAAAGVPVQPFAISFVAWGGEPVDADLHREMAWWRPEGLLPYLARLTRRPVRAVLAFGEPLHPAAHADRHELANACRERVVELLWAVRGPERRGGC